MTAASWLLLQMNQQNQFLILARQRKRALERQGLEAFTANVSIHQDWEHWSVLAQESQPNAALVPPPPRRGGLWGRVCGVFSQFIKMGERGLQAPKRRRRLPLNDISDDAGGCGEVAGKQDSREYWKPQVVFQMFKPHRLLSNVKLCSQTP